MPCRDISSKLGGDNNCYANASSAVENGKRFALNNRSGKTICRVRIDDCLVRDKNVRKCDFFFSVNEDRKFYLVELKGQAITDAVEQIKSTFHIVNSKLNEDSTNYTGIVVSSAVPKGADQKFKTLVQKMYRDHKLLIKRKQIHYEENI